MRDNHIFPSLESQKRGEKIQRKYFFYLLKSYKLRNHLMECILLLNYNNDLLCEIVYIPPEYSRFSPQKCVIELEQGLINITKDIKYVCLLSD